MTRLSRLLRWLIAIPVVLMSLYIALMVGLYCYGLHLAPDDLAPARTQAPANIRALWMRAEVPGVERLPKLDPVTLLPRWYLDAEEWSERRRNPQNPMRRAEGLLSTVTRLVALRGQDATPRRNTERHLAEAATMIHISRRWTLD